MTEENKSVQLVIDKSKLKRTKKIDKAPQETEVRVDQGYVKEAMSLAFNPTPEKIREVTIIDKRQAKLFPMLDVISSLMTGCIEIAAYRQNKDKYFELFQKEKPDELKSHLNELLYRTAQWQKSEKGANLTKITDIALAQVETRAGDDEGYAGQDPWDKDK
jgi:hypothetical protein